MYIQKEVNKLIESRYILIVIYNMDFRNDVQTILFNITMERLSCSPLEVLLTSIIPALDASAVSSGNTSYTVII